MKKFSLFLALLACIIVPHHFAEAKQFHKLKSKEPKRIIVQYAADRVTPNGTHLSNFGIIKLAEGETLDEKIAELKKDPSILTVAPNYKRGMVEITPNDTHVDEQYSVNQDAGANIDVTKAWTVTKGKKDTVIAVIDTGVQTSHEDISGKIWHNTAEIKNNGIDDDGNGFVDDRRGWDFLHDNNDPNPDPCTDGTSNDGLAHGTHVAGIAAANTDNSTGVAGIGWKTQIMALQVGDCDGSMTDDKIAEAIEYAVMMGADVINMSLGGFGTSSVLDSVVQEAMDAGVVVVAAAGNNAKNVDIFSFMPGCIDGVITVSSTNENDQASSFSNFGSGCVDLAAPGENILSTVYFDEDSSEFNVKYDSYSGTSMATPIVAGVAALLKAQEPDLNQEDVLNILRDTTDDVGLDDAYGTGRVNAVEALLALDSVNEVYIKAFNSSEKKHRFQTGETHDDRTPFFTWVTPKLFNENISGYYVYFGTDEDADAKKNGTFQTKNKFAPDKLPSANGKNYYLKVAVKLADDSIYSHRGKFTYILDSEE